MIKINFKLLTFTLLILFMMTFIIVIADAGPIEPSYSGEWMFTVNGNDNNVDDVENKINKWFDDKDILYHSDLEMLMKLEDKDAGKDGDFLFYFDNDKKSGTWYSSESVKFYSVKGSDQYAMYWVNPSLKEGLFSMEHIFKNGKNPDLSHITFWTNNNTYETTSTPEPSTMALFFAGLLSLSFINRKL